MNILVIAHFQNDGSPYVSFVHDQVKAYKELGHNVCVISPVVRFKKQADIYRGASYKVVDGIGVYYPRHLSFSKYGNYRLNSCFGWRAVNKLFKKIKKVFRPDIIHSHTIGFDGTIGVRLKEKYKIPLVITSHGSDFEQALGGKKEPYIINVCKKSDAVVVVSTKLKNLMKNTDQGLSPYVITNGFNRQPHEKADVKKHSIIQVGSLIKQKNFDITIRVLYELRKEYHDASLTIVGDGPKKDDLQLLCDKLHLNEAVTFTGHISNQEVMQKMATSEIFIMPSIKEGFGIVYLEAMSCGCITFGTKGEGIEDVIENERNGFLIEPDHPEVIVDYIKKCFNDEGLRTFISYNGKESVKMLSWEANAGKHIELFSKIIKKQLL